MAFLYLLHFDKPYKHARHYLGYTDRLRARLARHEQGHGARLLQVVQQAGITWVVARTWANATRTFERQLKRRKCGPRLCPLCQKGVDDVSRSI